MTTLYIARIFLDLSLYFAFFPLLLSLSGLTGNVMLLYITIAGVGSLCCILNKQSLIARLLPLLLLCFCFFKAETLWDNLLPVPGCIYVTFLAVRNKWMPSYSYVRDNFSRFILIYSLFISLFSFMCGLDRVEKFSFPFILIWLFLSIYLMRILRAPSDVMLSRRYKLINIAMLFGVSAVAALASSKTALAFFGMALSAVYKVTMYPLLLVLGYIISGLVQLLGKLSTLLNINLNIPENERPQLDINAGSMEDMFDFSDVELVDISQFLTGIGVVFGILLVIYFLRKVLRSANDIPAAADSISREKIETQSTGKRNIFRIFAKSTNREKIREYYKKYLNICKQVNIPVDGSFSSTEIRKASSGYFDSDSVRQLHEIWLPARYSNIIDVTDDDVKTAKEIYKKLDK